jgi:hypothetical protein
VRRLQGLGHDLPEVHGGLQAPIDRRIDVLGDMRQQVVTRRDIPRLPDGQRRAAVPRPARQVGRHHPLGKRRPREHERRDEAHRGTYIIDARHRRRPPSPSIANPHRPTEI